MKHTVATCVYLLVVVQWRLVDAAQGSTAQGAGGAWRKARARVWGTRREHHARRRMHAVRGGSVRGASFSMFRKVRVARCRGARRVYPIQTDERPDRSITEMHDICWIDISNWKIIFSRPSSSAACIFLIHSYIHIFLEFFSYIYLLYTPIKVVLEVGRFWLC
jgi:hypothetical protein